MKIWARVLMASLAAMLAPTSIQAQPKDLACELHVWPTSTYGAIYYGAENFRPAVNMTTFDLVITPREAAKRKLELALPVEEESRLLTETIARSPKFSGYRVVLHEPPAQTKYAIWYDKTVGFGTRDSDSTSRCYAELHVIFITIEKTALSKKFETGFLFRSFGGGIEAIAVDRFGGNAGLAEFDFKDAEIKPAERADLATGFVNNLEKFLGRKRVGL